MKNDFLFEGGPYNRLLHRLGIGGKRNRDVVIRAGVGVIVCWLPLAVLSWLNGSFWTGDAATSFISNMDVQTRLLVTMPIFIIAEKMIGSSLTLTLGQFIRSGVVDRDDKDRFEAIIIQRTAFLNSRWTDIVIIVLCYAQVLFMYFYERDYTSLLSWQLEGNGAAAALSAAGLWSILVSRPLLLFLFYRWIMRIVVWGIILFRVSRLRLNLFPANPDQVGGLWFLGYSIRHFSPVAFAVSAAVAGSMADFILIEGAHVQELRIPALLYLIFITLLFALPLVAFSGKMVDARVQFIHEVNSYTNGVLREIKQVISPNYQRVTGEVLERHSFSTAHDLTLLMNRALQMRFLPFTLKDLLPLLITAALPFVGVMLLEVPFMEVVNRAMKFVV
jgi:hypothetical protein